MFISVLLYTYIQRKRKYRNKQRKRKYRNKQNVYFGISIYLYTTQKEIYKQYLFYIV